MNLTETEKVANVGLGMPHSRTSKPSLGSEEFADMLKADRLKAESIARRDDIIANQAPEPEAIARDDIEFIREHGMQAYAEDVKAKKIEEMREEILAKMGLTEEALEEMPAGQRSVIEQMITDRIKKRMEANSLMNDGKEHSTTENGSYLKSMMMANGSSLFFDGQSGGAVGNLKEHLDSTIKNDPAYAFFRSRPEEK